MRYLPSNSAFNDWDSDTIRPLKTVTSCAATDKLFSPALAQDLIVYWAGGELVPTFGLGQVRRKRSPDTMSGLLDFEL